LFLKKIYHFIQRTVSQPGWPELTAAPAGGVIPNHAIIEDLEEVEGLYRLRFDADQPLLTPLLQGEVVKSMCFDTRVQMSAPDNLYKHSEEATTTRVRTESVHQFTHSDSVSFLHSDIGF
jgi:hypothetical protein